MDREGRAKLISKLEGADPEADVLVRDLDVGLLADDAAAEPPAEQSPPVVSVVNE